MEEEEEVNAYLQSCGGFVACHDAGSKGRILVATRDYQSGEVIYSEPPLHIIEEDEDSEVFQRLEDFAARHALYSARWYWCALNSMTASDLEQFAQLPCSIISEGLQRQLLWLCAPDENASEALPVFQELLHDLGMADVPTEVTRKFWQLLQVWKYNSFEYSDDPVASAIYLQASFHSHDCNPNANWVADDAGLTLRARHFIPAGQEVTISYLSDEELFESTSQRRMRLKISKDFHCCCQRCAELWDRSRGVRCQCGSLRFLDVEGSMLSPCDAGCNWPSVDEVLRREELLVLLCRQQADADRAMRLASAQTFAAAAEQLLPRHWATECLWKWLAEGCATKLEAKDCEAKRLRFLQDAYEGAKRNTHTAWVMSSLAIWTLSSCGALQHATPPDCSARVRDSGALELLKEAAGLLKDLNGEDDKYFRHVQRNLERVSHLDTA